MLFIYTSLFNIYLFIKFNIKQNFNFNIQAVQCPIPEDPINGRAVYTSVSYDSVVKYECKYGFKLHGPQNRSCTSNKQWSDEQPKCQGLCDLLLCFNRKLKGFWSKGKKLLSNSRLNML